MGGTVTARTDAGGYFRGVGEHALRDLARVPRGLRSGIGVVPPEREVLVARIEEASRELGIAWRAKPDGPGKAFRLRDAVVRDAGGKVEHVPRLEHPFFLGPEASQDLERKPRHELVVALARDLPAAAAMSL